MVVKEVSEISPSKTIVPLLLNTEIVAFVKPFPKKIVTLSLTGLGYTSTAESAASSLISKTTSEGFY